MPKQFTAQANFLKQAIPLKEAFQLKQAFKLKQAFQKQEFLVHMKCGPKKNETSMSDFWVLKNVWI